MTNADTLLRLINQHPEGLDDDEVSNETGVKPRQQVYYICTRLAAEGRIRRVSAQKDGKRRKIHNFPAGATLPASSIPQEGAEEGEKGHWRRRLSMLVAATGRAEIELLDEALLDLAKKVLTEEVGGRKKPKLF